MLVLARTATGAIAFGILAFAGAGAMPGASEASGDQFEQRWGDLNCSGELQSVEALYPLQHVVGGFGYIANGICEPKRIDMFPETLLQIEGGPQVQWTDVDCNGKISAVDALWILRYVVGLDVPSFAGCPALGAMTTLSHVWAQEAADGDLVQFEEEWGDLHCRGGAQSADALTVLGHIAEMNVYIPEGLCWDEVMGMFPDTLLQIEGGPQVQWADVDCNGKISSVDALWILRYVVGLGVPGFAGCPEIGAMTTLSHVW